MTRHDIHEVVVPTDPFTAPVLLSYAVLRALRHGPPPEIALRDHAPTEHAPWRVVLGLGGIHDPDRLLFDVPPGGLVALDGGPLGVMGQVWRRFGLPFVFEAGDLSSLGETQRVCDAIGRGLVSEIDRHAAGVGDAPGAGHLSTLARDLRPEEGTRGPAMRRALVEAADAMSAILQAHVRGTARRSPEGGPR